jgi:hypothetical protein
MRHLWLVVLVACGGSPSVPSGPAPSGGGVPPLFAGLFVDGRKLTYKVETRTSHWDDADPKADQDGNVTNVTTAQMTCRVRGMQNFSDAVAVKLECDRADDIAPNGVFVATPLGIWRLDAFPLDDAAIAKLPEADMILPAIPAAMENKQEDPEGEGGSMVAIEEKNGGWCKSQSSWGGDEGGTSLCFAKGKGLAGGSKWFAGGSTTETTFELVP